MTSTVSPKPLEITLSDFPSRAVAFMDEIIKFGLPGQEIITSTNLRPIEPDPDSPVFTSADGVMTDMGKFQYERACKKFDAALPDYLESQRLLLDYIVSALSSASKALLETRIGPDGYVASKAAYNTRRVWQLVTETHMGSSMRIKQSAMVNFLQHKQQPGQSFPEFLTIFRRYAASVTTYFGAASPHVGYISIDMLSRVLLVNNVDPVYFSRQKDRALEDFPDATSDELIAKFQQHVVETGTELTSTQFASRGLAASTIGLSNFERREKFKVRASGLPGCLGVFDSARASCSSCWDKGFIHTDHSSSDCPWTKPKPFSRPLPKKPSPKALAAPAEPAVSSSTALAISSPASDIDSARIFAARFETEGFAAYAKAMQTLGRDANIPPSSFFPCILGNDSLTHLYDSPPIVPQAFVGSSTTFPDTYYDNAASLNLVKVLSMLSNSRLLDTPFHIGGISSGALVTHVGELSFLPVPFRRCYFSIQSSVNLVALGYIQAQGGSYWSIGTNRLAVAGIDGKPFDVVFMQPNRLYSPSICSSSLPFVSPLSCSASINTDLSPVPYRNWQSLSESISDTDSVSDDASDRDDDVGPASSLTDDIAVACGTDYVEDHPLHSLSFPAPLHSTHVTAEQRDRCERANLLHRTKAIHCSDDVLCEALSTGRFPEWNLTPADVRLNRRLRGACVHCLLAKKKAAPTYTSATPPATLPGQVLHMDLKTRSSKSPGGKSVVIRMSDEFSGYHSLETAFSKEPKELFKSITAMVDTLYAANGHVTMQINADADPSFEPLIADFAAPPRHCKLKLMNPGSHESHIENLIGKDDARSRAVLSSLPYILPQQYEVYLDRWVADNANGLPNSRSRPSTADIIVTGRSRSLYHDNMSISFGDVVVVTQFKIKREVLARRDQISASKVNPGELAVVLGYSKEVDMDFDVLLANGQVVPRKYLDPTAVIPFGWKPQRVYHSSLSTPDPNPVLSSSPDLVEIESELSPILPVVGTPHGSPVLPFVSSHPLLHPEPHDAVVSSASFSSPPVVPTLPPRLSQLDDGRVVINSSLPLASLPPTSLPSPPPLSSPLSPPRTPLAVPDSSPVLPASSPVAPAPSPVLRRSGRLITAPSRFALLTTSNSIAPVGHRIQRTLHQHSSGRIVPSLHSAPSPSVVIDLVTPPDSPDNSFTVVSRRFSPLSNRGVTVRPSSYQLLASAATPCGDGLFTTRDFKLNERVSEYIGERISVAESNHRRSNGLGGYLLYLDKDTVLDCRSACARGHCVASKANSALRLRSTLSHVPARNNCDIRISNGRAYLVARHNLRAGTEILVPYGPRYLHRDFSVPLVSAPCPSNLALLGSSSLPGCSSPVSPSTPRVSTPTSTRSVKFDPGSLRHHVDHISMTDLNSLCLLSAIAVEEALCPLYLAPDEICLDTALACCALANPVALSSISSSRPSSKTSPTRPSDLLPIPSNKCKEIRLKEATLSWDRDKLERTTKVEIDKQIRLGCLSAESYDRADLPPGCAIVPGVLVYKDKRDGRATARLAANGPRSLTSIPATAPGTCTFAGVASTPDRAFCMAMMQAHCESRHEKLTITDFDVVGGFLHVKRTSKIRLFILLPKNLPHPDAGRYKDVFGCVYGLQESNNLFNAAVDVTAASADFHKCPTSPHTYVAFDPDDPALKCVANVIVDDFLTLDNMEGTPLTLRLKAALIARFTEITSNSPSTTFAGIEHKQLSNGAIATSQSGYINRVASIIGVSHLPPILHISDKTFFHASITPEDIVPTDLDAYTKLTGHLVHMLQTRDDVKHFISHLSSKNSCADVGDHTKAILLLRFLHSTSTVGRVFKSDCPQIVAFSDASFANQDNGRSTGAYFLSVGPANAPFISFAKALDSVSPCPMVAEYTTSNLCCQEIMHYRQFSRDLGWPPDGPTPFYMDSQTSINLVVAPEISKKSRFLAAKHHHIRERATDGDILPQKVSSSGQRADVMTKIFPPARMIANYKSLLNLNSII